MIDQSDLAMQEFARGNAAGERSATSFASIIDDEIPDDGDQEAAEQHFSQWIESLEQAAQTMAVNTSPDPQSWFDGWQAGFKAKAIELWPVEE